MEDEPVAKKDPAEGKRTIMSSAKLTMILQVAEVLRNNGLTVIIPSTIVILDENDMEVDRVPGPIALTPDPYA